MVRFVSRQALLGAYPGATPVAGWPVLVCLSWAKALDLLVYLYVDPY